MAFDINYLARVNTSGNDAAKNFWVYNGTTDGTNEALATITASAYFNAAQQNLVKGIGLFRVNDLILINGNDANGFYTVTSVTTNVTVSAFAAAGTIGTANIDAGAVTLPKLAAGISPSHVVKYAAQVTTAGGSASEAITVTGALATDLAFVQLVDEGTNTVAVVEAAVTADTLTVTFDADPGNDAVINYMLMRAAV